MVAANSGSAPHGGGRSDDAQPAAAKSNPMEPVLKEHHEKLPETHAPDEDSVFGEEAGFRRADGDTGNLHSPYEERAMANEAETAATAGVTAASPEPAALLPYTADWSEHFLLVMSCLSVAAVGLSGNAVRITFETIFVSHPFYAEFNYIEPNSIGCFLMGLFVTALPPEASLPLVYRGLTVGFCDSFTTFSTWMVKVMVQNTANAAFEHLFIGGTMPVVFFLWGRDLGRAVRYGCKHVLGCPWETWARHRSLLRAIDLTFFALVVVAAVLAPVLVQVYINKGRIRHISTDDVRMVVLAPSGAVPRFLLAVYLNKRKRVRQFPFGTLAANLIGVLIAIIMYNMQVLHPSNPWFVIVQQGISAALSTVSSMVNELFGFYMENRKPFAYLYALVSVGVSVFIAGIGRPQVYRRTVS